MRLIDYENRIKEMVKEDKNNPEIYDWLFNLLYIFFKRNKIIRKDSECVEVAQIGATDLYNKIYNGMEFYALLGYINVVYKAYLYEYRKSYCSEIIDATDNKDLSDAIILMSASSSISQRTNYEKILNQEYIDNLENTIDYILDKSKYLKWTKIYYNAKMSIMLSMLYGRFNPYDLDEHNINYVRMLYILTVDTIINNISTSNDKVVDIFKQYTLDNLNTDDTTNDYEFN